LLLRYTATPFLILKRGLTSKSIHILLDMLFFLIALSVGFEGGYNTPGVGFKDLNSGPAFSLYINRHFLFADLCIGARTSYFSVENSAYSLYFYGLSIGLAKNSWLFSPVIECGPEYARRKLGSSKESGYGLNYTLGFLINIHFEKLRLYPKFYYEGITDLETHAGFVGAKLGVGYEF